MARNRRKFSPEFKEEAAKVVVDTSQPIAHVARELNVNETTLGNWVKEYREKHAGDDPELPVPERAQSANPLSNSPEPGSTDRASSSE